MDGSEETAGFDYLATVKALLGISGTGKDAVFSVYIGMTRQTILNYCNISELPAELNYTLCQMAVDAYHDMQARSPGGTVSGAVSSISEDGRSVSFTSGTEFKTAIEDKVSHATELNRFKKLYRLD